MTLNNKKVALGVAACLGIAGLTISGNASAASTEVEFTDKNLCAMVASQVTASNIATDGNQCVQSGKLTLNDITTVTSLKISNSRAVTTLAGLGSFTSLTSLSITGQTGITDFSAVNSLASLTELTLDSVKVGEAFPTLNSLTALTTLNAVNGTVTAANIGSINNISNYTTLNISGNSLPANSLENLPVTGDGSLTRLTTLNAANNNIKDISVLKDFTALTTLNLSNNNVSDISDLEGLTSLRTLNLAGNSVTDLSAFEDGLTGVTTLNLSSNGLTETNLAAISERTSLSDINLSNNNINKVGFLEDFTSLAALDLSSNHISDFSPILTTHITGGTSKFSATGQTVTANISGLTYTLPALFSQVRAGSSSNDNTVSSLLYTNGGFTLENATVNDDYTTLTVTDPSKPATITIAAATGVTNAAANSVVTINSSASTPATTDPETIPNTSAGGTASVTTPNTGLFGGEGVGAVVRNIGLGVAAVVILAAPVFLASKRLRSRAKVLRRKK